MVSAVNREYYSADSEKALENESIVMLRCNNERTNNIKDISGYGDTVTSPNNDKCYMQCQKRDQR
jgi:hypothetical protein